MSYLNSQIILCKGVKMDRSYTSVCDMSLSDMLTMVNSSGIYLDSRSHYSFIRQTEVINADFNYSDAVVANYIAFQNPDYSNKWFFAWIDDVEYKGEKNVNIKFTVDQWSTWFNDLQKLPCLVEREHVDDDTFGRHNLPEPVGTDKMIVNFTNYKHYNNFKIVVFWMEAQVTSEAVGYALNGLFNTPANAFQYDNGVIGISDLLSDLAPGGEIANGNILSVHMVPVDFIPEQFRNGKYLPVQNETVADVVTMPAPTNLNGYVPINKKVLTYPYNFITVSNGNLEKIFKYEKFGYVSEGAGSFKIVGGVIPNGGATVYPMAYDGVVYENVPESMDLGDFPMMPIATDTYAAWLAQKSSGTIARGILSTLTGAIAGGMKGSWPGAIAGGAAGLISGITGYVSESEAARSENDRVTGTNNTTIDMVQGLMGYTFCQKCMVADDAKRVDNFFSQFGYNVSTVKIPNYTGRQYWNYVKINGNAGYGPLPEQARETINAVLNKGVTIWHSHSYMGNYLIGGSKMENPIV